ncbi:MAG TPA: SGNH/GDSL hydrolase family protein [Candidatus Limnocylindrales bacterium]|nr:SGNH/GDSL hydrolase family protein [Candidatus Limnocylindrales bacterium]
MTGLWGRARWPMLRTIAYGAGALAISLALQPTPASAQPLGSSSDRGLVLGVRAAADTATLAGRTYVALGDSISEGKYAVGADRIFPARIASQLGMRLDLIARSGARAAWALPQLDAVRAAQPALVTIELGTNDVGFNTPVDAFTAQYEAIVAAVSTPGTRVLCLGSWLPSDGYDAIIRDACERHGGTFVSLSGFYFVNDFHAPDGAATFLGRSDWFHPGDEGHAAIAAVTLAALPGYRSEQVPGVPEVPASLRRAPS